MRILLRVSFVLTVLSVGCGSEPPWPVPPHRPFPQVSSTDGAVLAPMRLVTIVSAGDADVAPDFFRFSDHVGESDWWRRIAPEYGLGTLESISKLTGTTISTDVSDHDVFTYITQTVEAHGGPAKDGNTLYLLYLPAGVAVIQKGVTNTGCSQFGGYHARYGILGDNLAVIQRCVDPYPVENMTVAASHEILEAATDPDQRSYALPRIAHEPWKDDIWNAWNLEGSAELADLCEGTFHEELPFVFQRIWSNVAAAKGGDPCVPELPEPFYDTTVEHDWYAVIAGDTVSIPVTGWSTGPTPDWGLEAQVSSATPGFAATPDSLTLHSGVRVNLVVSAPVDAPSASFAVIELVNTRPTASPGQSQMTDGAHISLVGVYVP